MPSQADMHIGIRMDDENACNAEMKNTLFVYPPPSQLSVRNIAFPSECAGHSVCDRTQNATAIALSPRGGSVVVVTLAQAGAE